MTFAETLLAWFDEHGRHDLPWQHPRTPYRVWLSEIMLQQTQVATVMPYFARFLERFPDLAALATAPVDDVLAAWAGLGYYSRARNLHRCARVCLDRHGGQLPDSPDALADLPGIGRSTAAAILSQAFGKPAAVLDGNVKRVLARCFGIDAPIDATATTKDLWHLAESLLPASRAADYTQAIMDLGATVCTPKQPACGKCPLAPTCVALRDGVAAELPRKSARRVVPRKAVQMLVLCDRDAVLLERRPEQGLWGGLHALPEFAPDEDVVLGARARFGLDIRPDGRHTRLVHRFTHFVLDITAIRAEVVDAGGTRETSTTFHDRVMRAAIGMPKPVTRILDLLVD